MYRYLLFALFMLPIMAISSKNSFSQRYDGYCDGAKTTADALDCVNHNKHDVQDQLNDIYKKSSENRSEENMLLLDEAQKNWIEYRDAQCAWESDLTENPSLKKIYEMSCVALLTNLRTDLLATTLERELDEEPREFSAYPRWMNVLAHDYSDVFWRYGNWIQADLNCDGDNEKIMTGIRVSVPQKEINDLTKLVKNQTFSSFSYLCPLGLFL